MATVKWTNPRDENDIPLCCCGCGSPVGIAKYDNKVSGHVAGQPKRYLQGHHAKKQTGPRTPKVQLFAYPEPTSKWADVSPPEYGEAQVPMRGVLGYIDRILELEKIAKWYADRCHICGGSGEVSQFAMHSQTVFRSICPNCKKLRDTLKKAR